MSETKKRGRPRASARRVRHWLTLEPRASVRVLELARDVGVPAHRWIELAVHEAIVRQGGNT